MKATGWWLLFSLSFPFFPGEALASYSYVDLHPAGWIESRATCVNGRGEVAGYGIAGSGERGFLWSAGIATEVLPPGSSSARAAWVNGQGDVAGTAVFGGRTRAFLYRNGNYLDPTPGWAYSEAVYVAEDGAVTGTGEFGAYISRDGVPELLPEFTVVVGVNFAGQLLGSAENTARLYLPGAGYITICPPRGERGGAGRAQRFRPCRGLRASGRFRAGVRLFRRILHPHDAPRMDVVQCKGDQQPLAGGRIRRISRGAPQFPSDRFRLRRAFLPGMEGDRGGLAERSGPGGGVWGNRFRGDARLPGYSGGNRLCRQRSGG